MAKTRQEVLYIKIGGQYHSTINWSGEGLCMKSLTIQQTVSSRRNRNPRRAANQDCLEALDQDSPNQLACGYVVGPEWRAYC